MMSHDLPSVLQGSGKTSSISMERALKQILYLLEYELEPFTPELEDRVNASIDDVKTMLGAIA